MPNIAFIAPVNRKWHTSPDAIASYTYVPAASTIPGIGGGYPDDDPTVHIKLFNPVGSWTWYLTEANRETGEAFGLVDGVEPELSYIDLNELAQAGEWSLPIERDIHFKPTKLSVIREQVESQRRE